MPEKVTTIPGRPEPLELRPDVDGSTRWTVGDCTGNEPDRATALRTAERFLGVRVVVEHRPAADLRAPVLRAEIRQVGPSSRRPGSGPTVGVTYVADRMPASYHVADMCPHGLPAGHCGCGEKFCSHPGALAHACEASTTSSPPTSNP